MFALRFFRPTFGTTLRSFRTRAAATSRSAFTISQTPRHPFRASVQRPRIAWHIKFRHAQARAYRRQAFNYQTFKSTQGFLQRWASRPTFYYEVGGIAVACGGFYAYNLEEVPVSHRHRFNVVKPEWEASIGAQMMDETMSQFGHKILPPYSREHRMVQRVLDRLIPASGLTDQKWEIHVIDDRTKNAFVIPGGKVFVFKGILDVCQGEDGLAAVLGHEIAHNVAHHAAERMSQAFILLPVALIGGLLFGIDPSIGRFAVNLAFTLPGSRNQEAEADYIGLLMMAESCYDPKAAMGLWSRMEQEEKGAPPQFLSTHPSSHNRLEKISGWLPKAETAREDSDCHGLLESVDQFRRTVQVPRR